MCIAFLLQHLGCDHLAPGRIQRCAVYQCDPFHPSCQTVYNTSYVLAACDPCQEDDPANGNFGLIPDHSRSINDPKGPLLANGTKIQTGGRGPHPMAGTGTRGGRTGGLTVMSDAPLNSFNLPIDLTGRPLSFVPGTAPPADLEIRRAKQSRWYNPVYGAVRIPKDPRGRITDESDPLKESEPEHDNNQGFTSSESESSGNNGGGSDDTDEVPMPTTGSMGRWAAAVRTRSPRYNERRSPRRRKETPPITVEDQEARNAELSKHAGRKPSPKREEGKAARRARMASERDMKRRAKDDRRRTGPNPENYVHAEEYEAAGPRIQLAGRPFFAGPMRFSMSLLMPLMPFQFVVGREDKSS